jgi:hypothetical protein
MIMFRISLVLIFGSILGLAVTPLALGTMVVGWVLLLMSIHDMDPF